MFTKTERKLLKQKLDSISDRMLVKEKQRLLLLSGPRVTTGAMAYEHQFPLSSVPPDWFLKWLVTETKGRYTYDFMNVAISFEDKKDAMLLKLRFWQNGKLVIER